MKNCLSHNIELFYVINTNFCFVRVLTDHAMIQYAKNPFLKIVPANKSFTIHSVITLQLRIE